MTLVDQRHVGKVLLGGRFSRGRWLGFMQMNPYKQLASNPQTPSSSSQPLCSLLLPIHRHVRVLKFWESAEAEASFSIPFVATSTTVSSSSTTWNVAVSAMFLLWISQDDSACLSITSQSWTCLLQVP